MNPRALVLLDVIFMAASACHDPRRVDWTKVTASQEEAHDLKLPVLIPDSQLKAFLPERVGGRLGAFPQGTMTRMGDRALSEASRDYRGGPPSDTGTVQLKIADAWLEPRATQAIRSLANADFGELAAGSVNMMGGPALPERLVLPGAVGYARYDEGARTAQAQVLIADRFIASATVAQAEDAEDAAQALRALDTLALARLAQPK